MPDDALLLAFVAASLVVLMMPGPGVVYVVARSVTQGRRAGLVSAMGLSAGALVQVAAATIGLSAIVLASATAFGVVKAVGAGYLIYLGVKTLLARTPATGPQAVIAQPPRRLFADGVVVSVFNPKIAVFFLAYLPQFVDPSRGPVPQQILLLGTLYSALALITDGAYALLAGGLRGWLAGRVAASALPRRVTGALYIGLGINAALAERPR
ncbi:MAG: LysE family translocator [Pseudomonadota bacterium]